VAAAQASSDAGGACDDPSGCEPSVDRKALAARGVTGELVLEVDVVESVEHCLALALLRPWRRSLLLSGRARAVGIGASRTVLPGDNWPDLEYPPFCEIQRRERNVVTTVVELSPRCAER
jgi:hypothetical protein